MRGHYHGRCGPSPFNDGFDRCEDTIFSTAGKVAKSVSSSIALTLSNAITASYSSTSFSSSPGAPSSWQSLVALTFPTRLGQLTISASPEALRGRSLTESEKRDFGLTEPSRDEWDDEQLNSYIDDLEEENAGLRRYNEGQSRYFRSRRSFGQPQPESRSTLGTIASTAKTCLTMIGGAVVLGVGVQAMGGPSATVAALGELTKERKGEWKKWKFEYS